MIMQFVYQKQKLGKEREESKDRQIDFVELDWPISRT